MIFPRPHRKKKLTPRPGIISLTTATATIHNVNTSLVDAYTKVLQPTAAQRAYVESGRDRQHTLERCVHRWEYDREKKAKKEATLAAADADRVAFRSIDWHDFVVVEVSEPWYTE